MTPEGPSGGAPRADPAPAAPPALPSAAAAARAATLRVLTANLAHRRTRGDVVARALRAEAADLVALQEVGPHHAEALGALRDLYPHRIVEPRGITGLALLARERVPFDGAPELAGDPRRPLIRARVRCGEALARDPAAGGACASVLVLVAHPSALVGLLGALGARHPTARDVLALGRAAAARAPALLLGDLNATPRHPLVRALVRAGLADPWPALGRGPGATFPVFGRYLALPLPPFLRIDHALATRDLVAVAARPGPDLGSDHRSLRVDFALRRT